MLPLPILFCLCFLLGCIATPEQAFDTPPNVIIMVSDDQGYGDLSVTGNPYIQTPNIDGMATRGAFFNHFYVSPVCSPTRAELLTGRYAVRGGVFDTSAGGERLDLDEVTLAEVFKAAGYATAAYGKWHNGQQFPYHPNGRGFDDFYGFASGHWGSYFNALMEHNGRWVEGQGFMADDLTEHALAYIDLQKDQPFFLYIPFNTPHSPMQVPEQYWQKFDTLSVDSDHRRSTEADLNHTRAAYAMCENLDWNVGRVIQKVKESGLSDKTIILYFSDNGPNGHRWNAGLKGIKGSTDEGGVRSPLIMVWEGTIPAGKRIDQVSGAIDLLPTLAGLAGIDFESRKPLDGRDISRHILEDIPTADRALVSHWAGRTSIRTQQYRLDHEGNLYDVDADPGQTRVLGTRTASLRDSLLALRKDWENTVLVELTEQPARPIPVGAGPMATVLPARDALFSPGINRSNRWPNCSFLTDWTSASDSIFWEIEVAEAGLYEVIMHYTTPMAGATIALKFADEQVSEKIPLAFESPLRGMEHDRYPRGESYVKDFRPWELGRIYLEGARDSLVLRMTDECHSGVDMRMLELKKIKE